jgi:hypothetical protein
MNRLPLISPSGKKRFFLEIFNVCVVLVCFFYFTLFISFGPSIPIQNFSLGAMLFFIFEIVIKLNTIYFEKGVK